MGAFLQGGLHHDVALHAHLELRDLGRDRALHGGLQRPQELSSSDSVHDHSPVLTHREWLLKTFKLVKTEHSNAFISMNCFNLILFLSEVELGFQGFVEPLSVMIVRVIF